MNKINRRNFMKMVGAAAIVPIAIAKAKPKTIAESILKITSEKEALQIAKRLHYKENCQLGLLENRDYTEIKCHWDFYSQECDYKGNDEICSKSFEECRDKGNATRFGGYPLI